MGEVELGAIEVDVGRELRWDLVVTGEVYRTGRNCVDVDEFWAQEETVGEFLKAWAMRKSVPRIVLHHTIHRYA